MKQCVQSYYDAIRANRHVSGTVQKKSMKELEPRNIPLYIWKLYERCCIVYQWEKNRLFDK